MKQIYRFYRIFRTGYCYNFKSFANMDEITIFNGHSDKQGPRIAKLDLSIKHADQSIFRELYKDIDL